VLVPQRLLITGIPATGKSTIGDYLAGGHGFVHLDFESPGTLARYVQSGVVPDVEALLGLDRDTAITWGFVPDLQLPAVRALRDAGFEWFWFDGDREVAKQIFVRRATVPVDALVRQTAKIEQHIDLISLQPRIVNPFDGRGRFRPKREIAAELLAPGS
jgi:hypothetical protein